MKSRTTGQAIIDWVNARHRRDMGNTLLIVTTTTTIFVANGATVTFETLQDKGPGLPGQPLVRPEPRHGSCRCTPLARESRRSSAWRQGRQLHDGKGRKSARQIPDQTDVGTAEGDRRAVIHRSPGQRPGRPPTVQGDHI